MLFPGLRLEAAPSEIGAVVERLGVKPPAAILDLCCGPGRHSLELARRGFRVTGVDRTATYLRQARAQARREKLRLRWVRADMRRFRQRNTFDAAINMFTSFGYFRSEAQNLKVLRNVHASLRPGGRFLMDLLGKEVLARKFQTRDWDERDGYVLLQERTLRDDWSWVDSRWIIFKGPRRFEYTLSHWLYSAAELRGMLRAAGFCKVDIFGDLAGAPYDQNAKRLVALARR